MLYIEVFIEGSLVKALVDSGARTTMMSETCARKDIEITSVKVIIV